MGGWGGGDEMRVAWLEFGRLRGRRSFDADGEDEWVAGGL